MCLNFIFYENQPQKRSSMSCKYSLEKLIKGRAWQSHYYVCVKFNSTKTQMPLALSGINTHCASVHNREQKRWGGTEQTSMLVYKVSVFRLFYFHTIPAWVIRRHFVPFPTTKPSCRPGLMSLTSIDLIAPRSQALELQLEFQTKHK